MRGSRSIQASAECITIRVPLAFRRRGGRKVITSPDGALPWAPTSRPHEDATLVNALARAFRWQSMLDTGQYNTVTELAAAEKLDRSFVSHMLRLNLLAPDIVEAILDGTQSPTLQLQGLVKGFSVEWAGQG
jgi:hypothetical protein